MTSLQISTPFKDFDSGNFLTNLNSKNVEELMKKRGVTSDEMEKNFDTFVENNKMLDELLMTYLKEGNPKKFEFLKSLSKREKTLNISLSYFNRDFISFVMSKLNLRNEPTYQGYPTDYLEYVFSPGYLSIITRQVVCQNP